MLSDCSGLCGSAILSSLFGVRAKRPGEKRNEFRANRELNYKENTVNSRMLTAVRSNGILAPNGLGSRKALLRAAVLAAVSVFSTGVVSAQGTAAAGAAASGKIGVISIRQAIASTAEGKQAGAELQSQFAPRQNELEGMNKQIADVRQRLDAGGGKLSQDETTRLTRQGEVLTRQLQRKQDEYQEDVNAAQGDVFDRIGRKMVDVLDRYARENGYVAIFDSSAQNTPILFASTNIDVTQDIVRLYDQAYPVKAGAAAPVTKPAAKPATPPAAKPQQ
jgi:outer membrane protein